MVSLVLLTWIPAMAGTSVVATIPQNRADTSLRVSAPARTKASIDDSLAAEKRAWIGLRGFLDRAFKAFAAANPLGGSADYQLMERTIRHGRIGASGPNVPAGVASFVPVVQAIRSPYTSVSSNWQLTASGTESSFSPIGPMVNVDHQNALLRRGDSARLVVVSDVSLNNFFWGTLMTASLARMRSPNDSVAISTIRGQNRFVFSPMVPPDSMVVSLEISALSRGGGLARFGSALRPRTAGRIDLSDIILLDGKADGAATSASFESVMPRILSSTTVLEKSALGLFWEVYGLNANERPQVTVSAIAESEQGGIGQVVGGILGAQQSRTLQFGFADVAAAGQPIEGRTIVVDLSTLRPGTYTLEVQIQAPGEPAAVTRRRIQIYR